MVWHGIRWQSQVGETHKQSIDDHAILSIVPFASSRLHLAWRGCGTLLSGNKQHISESIQIGPIVYFNAPVCSSFCQRMPMRDQQGESFISTELCSSVHC